jgi:hypothetical protein
VDAVGSIERWLKLKHDATSVLGTWFESSVFDRVRVCAIKRAFLPGAEKSTEGTEYR